MSFCNNFPEKHSKHPPFIWLYILHPSIGVYLPQIFLLSRKNPGLHDKHLLFIHSLNGQFMHDCDKESPIRSNKRIKIFIYLLFLYYKF
jgi:hypothetical protein